MALCHSLFIFSSCPEAAATWQWYSVDEAALQGQSSIGPPLVVAEMLTAATGGTVSTTPLPHLQRKPGADTQEEAQGLEERMSNTISMSVVFRSLYHNI